MDNPTITLLLALSFLHSLVPGTSRDEPKCAKITGPGSSLKLAVNTRRNETGGWVTKFSAWKDSQISPSSDDGISFDVQRRVIECEGKEIVHVEGVLYEVALGEDTYNVPLLFHPRCANNAAISNDGRSAQKIDLDNQLDGVVLTNRPLKNNELFEVRLDKKLTKFSTCIGIGITIYAPSSRDIPGHMWTLKSGNWMYYNNDFSINGTVTLKVYGRNLNILEVGDRVGVLRNNFGSLHFFVNGVDQGPAASNIPYPIYGVFELFGNAALGTIVTP